jgi:hypothetical protein
MPRALWLADILADEFRGSKGFRVDVYPRWHLRGSVTFRPDGVMDHHTGGGTYNALLRYMAEGPVHPPLCNYATSRPADKVVRITVVAAGRANHAGRGSWPGWLGANEGNLRSLGGEHQNTGGQAWPMQQVEAMRRCAAALLRHMKQDASRRVDHRQYGNRPPGWAGRKVDRFALDPAVENAEVNRLLVPQPKPPLPPDLGDDDMASEEVLAALRAIEMNTAAANRMLTVTVAAEVAALRASLGHEPSPVDDERWAERIAAGTHTFRQLVEALRAKPLP